MVICGLPLIADINSPQTDDFGILPNATDPQSSNFHRSSLLFRTRMERTNTGFRFVIVRKRVLFPLTIHRISIKSNIGMDRHSVIVQHAFVNAFPDRDRNGLGSSRIDKKSSRLKYQDDARTEIPQAARGADK